MLNKFLPGVISCWEQSVLPSRAMNFIRASWKYPRSIRDTPSFQVVMISALDISAILYLLFFWYQSSASKSKINTATGKRQAEKVALKIPSRQRKGDLIYMCKWPGKIKVMHWKLLKVTRNHVLYNSSWSIYFCCLFVLLLFIFCFVFPLSSPHKSWLKG